MHGIRKVSIALFLVLLGAGIFSLWRLPRKPENVYAPLTAQIEERLGARFSFKEPTLVFTPFPTLKLKEPSLEPVTEEFPRLRADEVQFSFRLWPLLWRKLQISDFKMKGASGNFWGFPLQEIDLKVRGIHPERYARLQGKARSAEGKEGLSVKGEILFPKSADNPWTELGFKGDLVLDSVPFAQTVSTDLTPWLPEIQMSGHFKGKFHVEKERGRKTAEGLAQFEANDFRLGTSAPFLLNGQVKVLLDLESDSLEFQEISVRSPLGELDGKGMMNTETGEIGEVRFTGRKVVLEELVRQIPALQKLLPLDTGFSGESDFDLTVQGTWDYLSFHANWDLTPAVLTYRNIFSKPKDFPIGINFDFLLKGGSLLSGDFSVRIRQTTVKGSIATVDLGTGVGEVTILTNKFDLKGWETLLPPLSNYEISGGAKVLWYRKGKLTAKDQVDQMMNLTLEDVTVLSPAGRGVRGFSLLLDLSALSLHLKEAHGEIGGSSLQMGAEIYSLTEKPQGKVWVKSPRLDPLAVLENLKASSSLLPLPEKLGDLGKEAGALLERFLPKAILLEEFSLDVGVQQEKVRLENLAFQAFGGTFRFNGEIDGLTTDSPFSLEAEIAHASLARYFQGMGQTEKILEGNFFFNGKFRGEGIKSEELREKLTAEGTLSITNGDWHTLDLLGPVGALEPFKNLAFPASASTPFSDLKASWNYSKGKFGTQNLLLLSEHLWVKGEGTFSVDTGLNSRLEIYLSKPLTQKVLESWDAQDREQGKQMGPIPLLLLGNITTPEVKADDRLLTSFLENVRARRYRKILASPFRDE